MFTRQVSPRISAASSMKYNQRKSFCLQVMYSVVLSPISIMMNQTRIRAFVPGLLCHAQASNTGHQLRIRPRSSTYLNGRVAIVVVANDDLGALLPQILCRKQSTVLDVRPAVRERSRCDAHSRREIELDRSGGRGWTPRVVLALVGAVLLTGRAQNVSVLSLAAPRWRSVARATARTLGAATLGLLWAAAHEETLTC